MKTYLSQRATAAQLTHGISWNLPRAARTALAATGFWLLAACSNLPGTPTPTQVISFGDSLSDLGTYVTRTAGATPGRFTTNPGPIWVELVAEELGTRITGYRQAGWGKPENLLGGTAYGEGGSRVAEQPGSGNTDASAAPGSAQTTLPVREQIAIHLRRGQFQPGNLVLVWAGANDLFRQISATPEAGEIPVRLAAQNLVKEVRGILAAGKPRIAVLTIDDYGDTPSSRAGANRAKLSRWSNAFNAELRTGLEGFPVTLVDANRLLREARDNPASYGLKDGLTPACTVAVLPQRSVMFCTTSTLVAPNAHLTHLYADGVHLTSAGHRLVAQEVLRRIRE